MNKKLNIYKNYTKSTILMIKNNSRLKTGFVKTKNNN